MLVLVAVVPLLIVLTGYRYWEYREEVAATGEQTLELARSMSLRVEDVLQTRIAILKTLGTSHLLQAGNFEAFRLQAEEVIAQQFPDSNSNIVLLKEDGHQLVNTLVPPGEALPVRPYLESVRRAFAIGEPAVSDLYKAAVGARLVIAIDVPVKVKDGTGPYVLSLVQPSSQFNEVIRNQHLPDSWVASVFDRNSVNIARVPNPEQFVGRPASPSFIGPLQASREGMVENNSLEGIPLLSAWSRGENFGWSVSIGVPRAELVGPVISKAIGTSLAGLALLVVSLALAVYAAHRIAQPIRSLRGLAAADDSRALDEPKPTGLSEVDDVARALHTAEVERRRSHETETILRDGVETIPQGFSIYDEEDRLVMCNSAYRRLFPDSPKDVVVGARYEDIMRAGIATGRYADAVGREEEWIADRLREHRNAEAAVEQQLGDGRWVLVTKRRLSNGWIAGLRIDITALKLAEEALRDSEQAARSIVDSALDAIVQIDETGAIVEWNSQAEAVFGWSRAEAVRRPLGDLIVPPEHRFRHHQGLARFLAIGTGPIIGKRFEINALHRDGHEIQVEVAVTALRRGARQVFNGFIRDLTQKIAVENQLRQAQKMEAIGNLTGGMAHDFNNLLGIIIGNLDLARGQLGDDNDVCEMVAEALDAAWRGADLTRRLLAFARRQPLNPARIDINELVNDTVRLLRRLLGEDIEVSLNLAPRLSSVTADPAQLEASLANLATNARDAMPKGGRLIIATEHRMLDAAYAAEHPDVTPGDYVMIEIHDTGIGMTAETMSRIFEPFFTTKEAGKGTGLGLSMVFGFFKQSGGHISAYSEPGVGTTFRLYLPVTSDEAAEREVAEAPPVARGIGETILVVEDNPGMRRIALRQLRELGYQTLECDRAAAALELLQREKVDLLFTDIVMPGGLDGVELADIVRERWPNVRIILTSGFPQARVADERVGATILLTKPYHKEELAVALRSALDR